MSVHGKPVSELKEVGGCFFLANEDGLIWGEAAGEELAGEFAIRTPNFVFCTVLVFYNFNSDTLVILLVFDHTKKD